MGDCSSVHVPQGTDRAGKTLSPGVSALMRAIEEHHEAFLKLMETDNPEEELRKRNAVSYVRWMDALKDVTVREMREMPEIADVLGDLLSWASTANERNDIIELRAIVVGVIAPTVCPPPATRTTKSSWKC